MGGRPWTETKTGAGKSGDTDDGSTGPTAPKAVVFPDTGRVRALLDQSAGFRLSYDPVAAAFDYVESASSPVDAAVRYVEFDPREGAGRDVYIGKATIRPNGDRPLKSRTEEQTLGLTCEVLGKVYVRGG